MVDKRTLYALLAMLALFLVFDQFVWKPQRQQNTQAQAQSTEQATTEPEEPVVDSLPPAASAGALDSLLVQGTEATSISLKNSLMRVDFSSRGAVITQVELANFKRRDESNVLLVAPDAYIAGSSVFTAESQELELDGLIFEHELSDDQSQLRFYLGSPDAPQVEKIYSLDEQYGINLDLRINSIASVKGIQMDFSSGIADSEDYLRSKAQDYKFLLYTAQLQKFTLNNLKKKQPAGAISAFSWAAIRSKYFTIALKEKDPVLSRHFEAFVSEGNENPAFRLSSLQNQSRDSWQQSFLIYTGPADYDILKGYGNSMENIAERGAAWLRWLTSIFSWLLKFLHSLIPNYGVVIIIFSILMKVILHPFTHKQMDASLKMQRIQPQVSEIQAKYKNDPRVMQQELSKLYKEAGASPFSGCLPLLLQMPIFISLYNVLRYSLDMRNASFIFWLRDLSEPDKYMILPILMGVFMVLQSRMMRPPVQDEENMDDKQKAMQSSQKMMTWIMPVMMFFIFRSMPAGLVLYWTVFNVLSIVQQYYLQKHFRTKESQ